MAPFHLPTVANIPTHVSLGSYHVGEVVVVYDVKISALLPFPVRVNPEPYQVEFDGTAWKLVFERIQRASPDERIAGPGTEADLEQDRTGQLAYSKVTGEAVFADPPRWAIISFLGAINRLISHVRDLFDEFWIRPAEPSELYQLNVDINGSLQHLWRAGPGGGITLPCIGRTEQANARLVAALNSRDDPPVWRQMHLDAREALALGRDEECIVLTWSALESACRQAMPGLAHRGGLDVPAFVCLLESHSGRRLRHSRKRPPASYEDAIERVSDGLAIVEVAAELAPRRIYESAGVAASVGLAYRLRNRILHQGVRVDHETARKVWESVDFVHKTALNLRDVEPPPATLSWQKRFGRVRKEVKQFSTDNNLNLVLCSPEAETLFTMESMGDQLHISCATSMSQPIASAFMRIKWDSWQRARITLLPKLVVGAPGGVWLRGSVEWLIGAINNAVCLGEALSSFPDQDTALRIAKLGSSNTIATLANMPKLNASDARQAGFAATLAAYLCILPKASVGARLAPLKQLQPEVAGFAKDWATSMRNLDISDIHSRCAILRRIHNDNFWLDSIWVSCPIEQVNFGSTRWPMK